TCSPAHVKVSRYSQGAGTRDAWGPPGSERMFRAEHRRPRGPGRAPFEVLGLGPVPKTYGRSGGACPACAALPGFGGPQNRARAPNAGHLGWPWGAQDQALATFGPVAHLPRSAVGTWTSIKVSLVRALGPRDRKRGPSGRRHGSVRGLNLSLSRK